MSFMEQRNKQMVRREAAAQIFASLTCFERDLGQALVSGSALLGTLPDARSKAMLSAVVGHDVIDSVTAALGHVSQAMSAAVQGHHQLDRTRQALRLPALGGGDKDEIPAIARMPDDPARLARVVAGG